MSSAIRPVVRARRQGHFYLALDPEQAFDLFTPEGECRWVPGWEPTILGPLAPGTIFLTDHQRENTIWTILEADRAAGRLRYSRVSPLRRAGTVRVTLAAHGNGCQVTVAYDLTAIAADGENAVAEMDEEGFAAMLASWEEMIIEALDREAKV